MKNSVFIILIVIAIAIGICVYMSKSEKYAGRFSGPYANACEFNTACMWDTARTVQMKNGMEGVCTLNGMACPAFGKDHERARYAGKSPTMVDMLYSAMTRPHETYTQAGETALELINP
jgi:hypothetical protein